MSVADHVFETNGVVLTDLILDWYRLSNYWKFLKQRHINTYFLNKRYLKNTYPNWQLNFTTVFLILLRTLTGH